MGPPPVIEANSLGHYLHAQPAYPSREISATGSNQSHPLDGIGRLEHCPDY